MWCSIDYLYKRHVDPLGSKLYNLLDYHCRTLTTFRFPFPPRLGPGPPAPPPSVALIPALMVSIKIPAAMAGEYVDNRLFRAG